MRYCGHMKRVLLLAGLVAGVAACLSREIPPPVGEDAKIEESSCGTVFRDATVRGGSACCEGPASTAVGKADILAACGRSEAEFLGQTRDGAACRYHFNIPGSAPKDAVVVVSRPPIPPGAPAPARPDPNLPWTWKKLDMRQGVGFQALVTANDKMMSAERTTLWGAHMRRVVGLSASKKVCTETQLAALLQKAVSSDR